MIGIGCRQGTHTQSQNLCPQSKRYPTYVITVKKHFDSNPYSCRLKILITQAGLLTCPLIVPSRFPSGKEYNKQNSLVRDSCGRRSWTHSNRHCSGFAPDSLFTFRDACPQICDVCPSFRDVPLIFVACPIFVTLGP